jgi:Uma2 family endonuclease
MAEPARPLHVGNSPEVERAWREAPDNMVAEIVDGELSLHPRPARPHLKISSELGMELGPAFVRGRGGPGGWVIFDEPELWLGPSPDKLVPDLAGWRRERMPDAVGDDSTPPYFDLAPDWVCEVVSISTERIDRGKKMRIYAREGVKNLWLINPLAKTLEVYRLQEKNWLLVDTHEGDAAVRAEPFEAIELALGDLWSK